MKGGQWKVIYKEMFGEELKPNTERHLKLKKAIAYAKLKYSRDHPKDKEKHQAACDALRKSAYFADADKDTLIELLAATKVNYGKQQQELLKLRKENEQL